MRVRHKVCPLNVFLCKLTECIFILYIFFFGCATVWALSLLLSFISQSTNEKKNDLKKFVPQVDDDFFFWQWAFSQSLYIQLHR